MNLRQKQILEAVETEGEVTIKALAERLKVSEMTVHRDVDVLEEQRYLYKKRGAVVFIENSDRQKNDFYSEEKRLVGIKAASFISEGQSVIFDNSTTAHECAKFLKSDGRYTFYTTNIETSEVLSNYKDSVLYCCGGYYFPSSKGFIGKQAEEFIRSVKADVCIIGASGVSLSDGITTPYPMHTPLQKEIISSAKTKILVCDHSKFGKTAVEKICGLRDVDLVVTDSGISDENYNTFSEFVKIIKA